MSVSSNSKFFGQPNGTKPPAKQSKLSFSSKPPAKKDPPSSSSSNENEDVEMKDGDSETEVMPKVENKQDISTNEEAEPGMPIWRDSFVWSEC
jgi:DNA ligase-1